MDLGAAVRLPLTVAVVLPLLIVSLILAPSTISFVLFLFVTALIGSRILDLVTCNSFLNLCTCLPMGWSLIVLAFIIPFATGAHSLPIDVRSYTALFILLLSLATDLFSVTKGQFEKILVGNISSKLSIVLHSPEKWGFVAFAIALLCRLSYQGLNTSSILPDASFAFSAARSLAETGAFSANVLTYVPVTSPYAYVNGLIPEPGTWLLLGTLFGFGGISFAMLKLVLVITGSYLVLPAYFLARTWFNTKPAVALSLLIVQPALMFFSITPFGPEILSTLFALGAIAIIEKSKNDGNISASVALIAGIILGASMLIWEPMVIFTYVLALIISVVFVAKSERYEVAGLIVVAIGLGLTIVYAITWYVNAFIFLVLILPICLYAQLKRRRWFSLVWLFVPIATELWLWLNRFYVYPQLVIAPSLASALRAVPTSTFAPALTLASLLNSFRVLWQTLEKSATTPILIFFLVSLLILDWKYLKRAIFAFAYIVVISILGVAIMVPNGTILSDYSASRFFIAVIVFMTIVATETLSRIIKSLWNRTKTLVSKSQTQARGVVLPKRLNLRRLAAGTITVMLVIAGLSPFLVSYFISFDSSLSYLNAVNGPKLLGVLDSKNWILNHTVPDTVFQVVSDGTVTIWSMEISDRYFAGLQVMNSNSIVPYPNVDMSTVLAEAMKINASYVIMDPSVVNLGFTKLKSYYSAIWPFDIGETFPVFSENSSLIDILNASTLPAVQVAFVSSSSASKVVILKIEQHSIEPLWNASFTTGGGWSVALNGTILFTDAGMVVTAPPYTSQMVFAQYNFEQTISLSNNTYLALKVSAQDKGTLSGFYILFDSGKSVIMNFEAPSVYVVSLSQFVGQHPHVILLYDSLTPSTAGTAASYSVTYGWIALINV